MLAFGVTQQSGGGLLLALLTPACLPAPPGYDLNTLTMRGLYDKYSLDEGTRTFTGHAMALQRDNSYLDRPALETVRAIQLYVYSLERYGKSPYIYPIYGLGGLPEGFSRLCAINGGTFMLDHSVDEVLTDASGVAWGIRHGDEVSPVRFESRGLRSRNKAFQLD